MDGARQMTQGVGLIALAVAIAVPDLTDAARVGIVAAVMAGWWLIEPVPRAVTGVIPVVCWPLLGVRALPDVAASYAHPLLWLMAGGFLLGDAMTRVSLHERLVARLLRVERVSRSPQTVLLALMAVAAGLSGLVSNAATMVMMLPTAMTLADRSGDGPVVPRRAAFALALAYACSLGGVTTLIGTAPNAVLAGFAPTHAGVTIGFASWLLVGVPIAAVLVPVAWAVVIHGTGAVPRSSGRLTAPEVGPWRPGERPMLAVVVFAGLAWLTRAPKALGPIDIPGWGDLVAAPGSAGDAWVAIVAAFACFVLPGPFGTDGRPARLLEARALADGVAWPVLVMMGGGFALADGLGAVGLDVQLATWLAGIDALPTVLVLPVLVFGTSILTELTSNTATAQLLLPIVASAAAQVGAPPLAWMVGVTLATSCAFMMPVATPPNAIAAEAAGVDGMTMARIGWRVNLFAALWIAIVASIWAPWVLGGDAAPPVAVGVMR